MVESIQNTTNMQQPNPELMTFYDKSSCSRMLKQVYACSNTHRSHLNAPLHYPVLIQQHKVFPKELVVAHTDYSLKVYNLENGHLQDLQLESAEQKTHHSAPITSLHCPELFTTNENLMHTFMTASQDALVKIWDRRSKQSVAQLSSAATGKGKVPFFSVGTNSDLVVAGTKEDILIWDVHSLQKPLARFTECHNDQVTQIAFNSSGRQFISSSIDYVLSMFDLDLTQQKVKEDDVIDGAYSSMQPIIDCGFLGDNIIWAQSSINTIEFIRTMDATCFLRVEKFPHDVTYLIGIEKDLYPLADQAGEPQAMVYGGNKQGEVYIYRVSNLHSAFAVQDDSAKLPEAALTLVDIVLTNEPYDVRQIRKVGEKTFALATENNKVQVYLHEPEKQEQLKLQAQLAQLNELDAQFETDSEIQGPRSADKKRR